QPDVLINMFENGIDNHCLAGVFRDDEIGTARTWIELLKNHTFRSAMVNDLIHGDQAVLSLRAPGSLHAHLNLFRSCPRFECSGPAIRLRISVCDIPTLVH